ncbi:MAG TPA: GNAT family N-acetyltransferase [Acidimicrobiia bacterium]|nr:GNAT family N-acetyltransferase [Acidimicrobiia bacterium]
MTISIRLARPDEYERVAELTLAAYRALAVDHLWDDYDAEIADTATRAKFAEVLVAVEGDEVLGSVTYVRDADSPWREWTHGDEVQFRLLAVDPGAQGRGAGLALVRACLDRARADDRPILIHSTPWMATAVHMYERFGFARAPEHDVPYEEWYGDAKFTIPPEWVGQSFLAYSWTP